MIARLPILTLMVGALCSLCGCTSLTNSTEGRRHASEKRASLGDVEHRGRKHAIRDLMDPAYRAANNDGFARRFNPQTAFATEVPERVDAGIVEVGSR